MNKKNKKLNVKALCNKFINNINKQKNTEALSNLEEILKIKVAKHIKSTLSENNK